MKPITGQKKSRAGNPAITLLRLILWLVPSIIVPIAFFVSEMITHEWFAAVIPVFVICSAIGYFDCRLSLQQKRQPHAIMQRKRLIHGTILFNVLQLIIVPTLSFAILYGYCVVTGFRL